MIDTAAVLGDPDWLPHRIDAGARVVAFLRVPRDAHRAATFLDDAYLKTRETVPVGFAALPSPLPSGNGKLHFIFHSAFSCSTLLARALDMPGVSMGLKEPAILNELATLQRAGRDCGALPGQMLDLLARPFGEGEAVVIKPSNVVNILIEPMLGLRPDARALLLHAPIRTFLISVAKKGMWGRIWTRRLYGLLRQRPAFEPGYGPDDLFQQTDLQVAALGWLQQQAQFAEIVRRFGDRIRTLDSETLLGNRVAVLGRLGTHFGLPIDGAAAAEIAGGAVFAGHSKRLGEQYDGRDRAAETIAIEAAHKEEIDMVASWATTIAAQFGIPLQLDLPLLG